MQYNNERPGFKAAIVFLAIAITAMQCTKPEQDLGINLQDEDRLLSASGVDTFTVVAYTIADDSIRSDKFNPALLGAYVDPVFGFAKAEHITELRLSSANPIFLTDTVASTLSDLVVDSLVLTLSFYSNFTNNQSDAAYGNLGGQYFEVFEITENLALESSYYSNQEIAYIPDDLVLPGNNMVTPRPFDSTLVNGSLALPLIRIPLKTDLAERIISFNPGKGITGEQFVDLVKGIYITVDETKFNPYASGIIYFDTFSQGLSRVSMYYRNTALGDTLRYDFLIRNNSGKFTRFEHEFSLGSESLSAQVIEGIKDPGQRDLYVRAMGGTKLRVDFPHIEALKSLDDEAINLATLTLPVRMESIGKFTPPANFLIFGIRDDGSLFLLPDQLDGAQFIGGFFDPENGRYRFRITRYLQQVISQNREFNGFEIVSGSAAFSANRVVLNGPDYPDPASTENNAKLEIVFTKF